MTTVLMVPGFSGSGPDHWLQELIADRPFPSIAGREPEAGLAEGQTSGARCP